MGARCRRSLGAGELVRSVAYARGLGRTRPFTRESAHGERCRSARVVLPAGALGASRNIGAVVGRPQPRHNQHRHLRALGQPQWLCVSCHIPRPGLAAATACRRCCGVAGHAARRRCAIAVPGISFGAGLCRAKRASTTMSAQRARCSPTPASGWVDAASCRPVTLRRRTQEFTTPPWRCAGRG